MARPKKKPTPLADPAPPTHRADHSPEPHMPTEPPVCLEPPVNDGAIPAAAAGGRGDRTPGYGSASTDPLTGVTVTEHRYPFFGILRFAEPPSPAVRAALGERGFVYSARNKEWRYPLGFDTQFQDREHVRATGYEVRKLIREERGITRHVGG